jgi:hypothetical protein
MLNGDMAIIFIIGCGVAWGICLYRIIEAAGGLLTYCLGWLFLKMLERVKWLGVGK